MKKVGVLQLLLEAWEIEIETLLNRLLEGWGLQAWVQLDKIEEMDKGGREAEEENEMSEDGRVSAEAEAKLWMDDRWIDLA